MATINARTHEIVARSNRQAKKNERNNRNRANRTWQVSALWLMYTISMYSNAISLIVKWSWYDCMWNNISIQSRCNRSLSFGSKCHYSTRFSLFLPLFWFTLFHSSPHIRFHHFHQSMQPFPRDNSSVFGYLSSIWPFFLRRSFQVFFFHSFIRFILQNLPIRFATIYIFCPHEHIHVHILRGISIFGENQYYVSMWFVTILNKVWTWTPDFQ